MMDSGTHSTIPSRQWAKKTPSPPSLRDKVVKNCLSAIKSKRKSLFEERRWKGESRNDILKAFVSEMYHAAKQDDTSDRQEDQNEAEMLAQIQDAIEFELERQREVDSQLLEFIESEEFARINLYEQGEDAVICPVCRDTVLSVDEHSRTAFCDCGLVLDVSALGSMVQTTYSAALKDRLANVFDRHQVLCEVFSHAMRGGHYQGYHCGEISTPSHRSDGQEKFELAFQVRAGRLFAQCIECSFYEQVT